MVLSHRLSFNWNSIVFREISRLNFQTIRKSNFRTLNIIADHQEQNQSYELGDF